MAACAGAQDGIWGGSRWRDIGAIDRSKADEDARFDGVFVLRTNTDLNPLALQWLSDPDLRQRSHAGLNKGEASNALRRAVFFHRQGEIRDRTFENQSFRASGLSLITAAIVHWNTVYLDRVVQYFACSGHPFPMISSPTSHVSDGSISPSPAITFGSTAMPSAAFGHYAPFLLRSWPRPLSVHVLSREADQSGHAATAPAAMDGRRYVFAALHHRPDRAGHFVCERDGDELTRLAEQQRPQPVRHLSATRPHGGINHRGGTRNEQHTEPFITGPADAAHALFAAGRTFLRREACPCGQMAARFEHRWVDLDRPASTR